eukprot:scaffold10852_cov17-Tisochrysis_lutea.AAC.1
MVAYSNDLYFTKLTKHTRFRFDKHIFCRSFFPSPTVHKSQQPIWPGCAAFQQRLACVIAGFFCKEFGMVPLINLHFGSAKCTRAQIRYSLWFPHYADEDPNKATSDLTPEFVKEDIQQRNGENKGTEEADRSIFSGLGIGQLFDRQQQQQQQQKQQSSNSDEGFGKSASFQLHGEEVVVVAGCTPSA